MAFNLILFCKCTSAVQKERKQKAKQALLKVKKDPLNISVRHF
jgi:hypothetical protein